MEMQLAILIGQLLFKFGPTLAREFQILITKENPTQADWDKVFALAKEPWKDMSA